MPNYSAVTIIKSFSSYSSVKATDVGELMSTAGTENTTSANELNNQLTVWLCIYCAVQNTYRNNSTFWETHTVSAFFLRVRWEQLYHFHVCVLNTELQSVGN